LKNYNNSSCFIIIQNLIYFIFLIKFYSLFIIFIFKKKYKRGFVAARKHQDKILILVKMLYSGHGTTMPCFEKGE
jgi:hypothetical protein